MPRLWSERNEAPCPFESDRGHPPPPRGRNVKLSAAMIVKNEAPRLARCLDSIHGVVDELVVVDTGSTDETVEIARAHGAIVHHDPWRDDFSYHRNRSLEYATGDWVLVIDGDEQLVEAGNLRTLIEEYQADEQADGIAVRVESISGAGVCESLQSVRAFRRDRGRYRYPVHNQLLGIERVLTSSAVLHAHYGDRTTAKAERSIPLLLHMLEEDPECVHAAFFLCKTYCVLGDFDACRRWGKFCRERVPDTPVYAQFWTWLFYATLVGEGLDAAEAVLEEALNHHPRFAELRHCQITLGMIRWNATAATPEYAFASQPNRAHLANLPRVAELLGIPIEFSNTIAGSDPLCDRAATGGA